MTSGLAIRGVPIESAIALTGSDVTDPTFAAAQARFESLRGPGTPLRPALQGREGTSPAPYLRAMLERLLRASAAGETVDLVDENDVRVYMELRLALVEVLAARAEAEDPAPEWTEPPAPAVPDLLAVPAAEPSWLPELVVRSLMRCIDAADSAARVEPERGDGLPPHLRLGRESAYWRGVPPHGAELVQLADGRADSLAEAVRAGRPLSPVEAVPLPLPRRPEAEWVRSARTLLSRVGRSRFAPSPPAGEGLAAAVAAHFGRGAAPPSPPAGTAPVVLSPGTAETILGQIDVMRNYGIQLL